MKHNAVVRDVYLHSNDKSGWNQVKSKDANGECWIRKYRELDECSMIPDLRVLSYNRIIRGYTVRWPVGDTATGVTCCNWFEDEDEARCFMVRKMLCDV